MLVKNKKIEISDRRISVNVPINTQIEKIVSDIFENSYMRFFRMSGVRIDLSDVLFISDSHLNDYIDIPRSYFEETTKIMKEFGDEEDRVLSIPCINAFKFENQDFIEESYRRHRLPSLVIIGFINNIPEYIYSNIINMFGRSKVYIFGDEVIAGPELGSYFNRILTNSEYSMKYSYCDYKVSIHKKINSILNKLRDKKLQSTVSVPCANSLIRKTVKDNINIDDIQSSLEKGYNVVVPRRLVTTVNSRLKNLFSEKSDISLDLGTEAYTRYPFVTRDKQDRIIVVPALSHIQINLSNDAERLEDTRRILLRNIIVTKPNGIKIDLDNIPIDYTGYLMQFDPNEHYTNYDDFDEISFTEDPILFDPSVMSLMPHRVFTNVEQKYIRSNMLLVYLENIENDPTFKNNSLAYQEMSNVEEELELVVSNKFDEL